MSSKAGKNEGLDIFLAETLLTKGIKSSARLERGGESISFASVAWDSDKLVKMGLVKFGPLFEGIPWVMIPGGERSPDRVHFSEEALREYISKHSR